MTKNFAWWNYVAPELWMSTPIPKPQMNPLTGNLWGDDDGYRQMRTVDNPSPLVIPDVTNAAVYYLGLDEAGVPDSSRVFAGALPSVYLRECGARSFELADSAIRQVTGGEKSLRILDGLRTWQCQQGGFNSLFLPLLQAAGITDANVVERAEEFVQLGEQADHTFSYVPRLKNATYETVAHSLESQVPSALLEKFVMMSANSGVGPARAFEMVPIFDNTEHGGGTVADVDIVDASGRSTHLCYFDYMGSGSRSPADVDFCEFDEHFDAYRALLANDPRLQKYVRGRMGIEPQDFSWKHWEAARADYRLLYHATCAVGCTYYWGEWWHKPASNIVRDPFTGQVVYREAFSADRYPDSGSVGRAVQTQGPDGYAVHGGNSGYAVAIRQGILAV